LRPRNQRRHSTRRPAVDSGLCAFSRRNSVKAAKAKYQDALRAKFFGFQGLEPKPVFALLPFTDRDTAFLWASLPMLLSSFAACLIVKRIGIIG
jgi:hypothetical protein